MSLTGQHPPPVTVAILAYNRRDPLAMTLKKILGGLDYPAERLQVVVVDNASADGTAEMVRSLFPSVELIVSEENTGIGGWNRAFAAGRGDWFLVLDDDCYVEGDALHRALRAASEVGADMVSFAVDSNQPGQSFTDYYRTGLLSFWGCSVLISRRAVEALGGFDEELFIWAHELDFTMRLLDRGLAHLYLPEVRSVHMKGLPGHTAFQNNRNLENWGYLVGRHLRAVDVISAFWFLLMRATIEAIIFEGFHGGIGALAKGLRKGLASRRPLRPALSTLYRREFIEFTSPFRLWWRLRHVTLDRRAAGTDYRARFWNARPRLYPRQASAIRLP